MPADVRASQGVSAGVQTIEERDALEKEEAEALLKHKHRLEDRKVLIFSDLKGLMSGEHCPTVQFGQICLPGLCTDCLCKALLFLTPVYMPINQMTEGITCAPVCIQVEPKMLGVYQQSIRQ